MRVPVSDSDADIWEFIKRECQTLYHPTSTCGIGSVVDPQLGVLGLEAMRVVDTSVMPAVIRGTSTRRRPGSVTMVRRRRAAGHRGRLDDNGGTLQVAPFLGRSRCRSAGEPAEGF